MMECEWKIKNLNLIWGRENVTVFGILEAFDTMVR